MERVIGVDHTSGRNRDETIKAERLRHRRAAEARCVRTGLLRRCHPVPPGAVRGYAARVL